MRKYIHASDKINSIKLELRHPNTKDRIWVLVEGESDRKLFIKLFDGPNVSVEQVNGLSKLREAVDELSKETDRVIGIRDADFLHIKGQSETIKNIFVTDSHDIEMMLIRSDNTFRSLIAEFCSENLADCFALRDKVLASIKYLGGIRYFNDVYDCGINFTGLGIGDYYDREQLKIDVNRCIHEINRRSPNRTRCAEFNAVKELIEHINDLYNLCCGHDFVNVLVLYFNNNGSNTSKRTVSQALRTAYTIAEFRRTNLYHELSKWESKFGYKIFNKKRIHETIKKTAESSLFKTSASM